MSIVLDRPQRAVSVTPPRRGLDVSRPVVFASAVGLLVVVNVLLGVPIYVPFVGPALGAICVLGMPVWLIYGATSRIWRNGAERLGLSLALAVMMLALIGLAVNSVLPYLGVRPLGSASVIITVDVVLVALGRFAYPRHPERYRLPWPKPGLDRLLLGTAAASVPLAAMGAVRLNNGAGGGLQLITVCLIGATLTVLAVRADKVQPFTVSGTIYCVALALLFMTSLRGWFTTGHDVQLEMYVFHLTKDAGRWNISSYRDPYNACLSITIVPTILWQWTRVDDVYVFKFFFQVIFAYCPVMVYRLTRRFVSELVAILAVIYFVGFVTYFQDMPMLNRQEMAFICFAAALLALHSGVGTVTRRTWFCVFALGFVVFHYSTTYVAIGIIAGGWVAHWVLRRFRFGRAQPEGTNRPWLLPGLVRGSALLALLPILLVGTLAFLWTAPLTHTQAGLSKTFSATLNALRGGSGDRATDTEYAVFGSSSVQNDRELVAKYDKQVATTRAGPGMFYPADAVAPYTPAPAAQPTLPITPVGHFLTSIGVDVPRVNNDVRQDAARLLQILVLVGLVATAVTRRFSRFTLEFWLLAAATFVVVALEVLLPVLSVDYGILRAFLQALVILSPFIVVGSMALVPRRFSSAAEPVAIVLAVVLFLSATGVITQVTGGYGPQLHLNNSGTYYDIYYLHPEEVAATEWLEANSSSGRAGVPPDIEMDPYMFNKTRSFASFRAAIDINPALIEKDAYVFLDWEQLKEHQANLDVENVQIPYNYPLQFLDSEKDLIYTNGGSSVYR